MLYLCVHEKSGAILYSISEPNGEVPEGCIMLRNDSWRGFWWDGLQFSPTEPGEIKANIRVGQAGDKIELTYPEDAYIRVGAEITQDRHFVLDKFDFRAELIGKYTGSVEVLSRTKEQLAGELLAKRQKAAIKSLEYSEILNELYEEKEA
jgi:hypothetical protein